MQQERDVVKTSKVALFADDTKIYCHVTSHNDCKKPQSDLDLIYKWSVTWHLAFNTTSVKFLLYQNPRIQSYTINYMLDVIALEREPALKELEIMLILV